MNHFYADKSILLTGVTGFLGKMVLHKLLRSLQFHKIYVVIRVKQQGQELIERLKKEVYQSSIFDQMRQRSEFEQLFYTKITAIQGDLLCPDIGLCEQDKSKLLNEVSIIINCAASVDFNASLWNAVQANIMGTLRMYELFSQLPLGLNFIHVSTCYVNSDMRGFIGEKIYEKGIDAIKMVEQLLQMREQDITPEYTKTILGGFPNTYTFTKYLAERMLIARRDGVSIIQQPSIPIPQSLTIVRPAIIGSSQRDPVQVKEILILKINIQKGWVDNVSAAGALFLFCGLGVVTYLPGNPKHVGDLIPVDYVADFILVASYFGSSHPGVHIMHSSSSHRNPVSWETCTSAVLKYWSSNPPLKRVAKSSFQIYQSTVAMRAIQVKQEFMVNVYARVASIARNEGMLGKAKLLQKMMRRARTVVGSFKYFTMNEWIYQSEYLVTMRNMLSASEREVFQLDIESIDWPQYIAHFSWGLHKFILKENIEPPKHQYFDLKTLDGLLYTENSNDYGRNIFKKPRL